MEASVTCALCSSLGSNDEIALSNTEEARKDHARTHFNQSKVLDGGITEDEVFQRCFTHDQPDVAHATLSQAECHQSLLDLCNSQLKERSRSAPIVCNLCDVGISIRRDTYCMAKHACSHLEVKLFKCRHCAGSLSNRSDVLKHIRQQHNILKPTSEDFEDKSVGHMDEISTMIKRCFSTIYPRASGIQRQFVIKSNCRSKRQQSVAHFCRSIFMQRSKPTSLDCNLCEVRIIIRQGKYHPVAMSQHASAHLKVKLFVCRHCDQSLSNKNALGQHLRVRHQITDWNNDDFTDLSEKFHSDLLNMIERCFSRDHVKVEAPATEAKRRIKTATVVRSRTTGSKRTIERRLFYNRLIRQAPDIDGKVTCYLCSKKLPTMITDRTVNWCAFWHVEMHLQKPIYQCKACKDAFSTRRAIRFHLKQKHALNAKKNYECVADNFHEEFMAMMSRCLAPESCVD